MQNTKAGLVAANDNARHADSFASLGERRAWLATLPAKAEPVLAWPTLERLYHLRDNERAVRALMSWRALNDGAVLVAANDNDPAVTEMGEDMRREIRPTERELLTAVADVEFEEPSDTSRQRITGRWPTGGDIERDTAGVIVRLGTLRIGTISTSMFGPGNRGHIVEWNRTRKGKPLAPVDRPAAPKGTAKPKRTAESIAYYLKRQGTPWPEQYVGPAEARVVDLDRTPATQAAAEELASMGVSGNVSFHEARANAGLPSAEQGQPYVHPAARWVGGLTHFKGAKQGSDIGELAAEADMARKTTLKATRRFLSEEEVTILDLALTDAKASDIGRAVGYSGSYAEKHGGRLVDQAIEAFCNTPFGISEKLAA